MKLLTLDNKTQHLAAWAREFNLTPNVLKHRLAAGKSLRHALTQPLRGKATHDRSDQKRALRAKIVATIQAFKTRRCCIDCQGKFHPEAMDFDHVRGRKLFDLSAACYYSMEKVAAEIAKCDLVCANCHRIRTFSRRL